MHDSFPQDRTHQDEWRNYWLRGKLIGRRAQMVGCMGHAVKDKLKHFVRSQRLLPDYLGKDEVRLALAQKPQAFRLVRRAFEKAPTFSPQLLAWAREYQKRFDDFLVDKKRHAVDPEISWNLHQFGWLVILALSETLRPTDVTNYLKGWLSRLGRLGSKSSWRSLTLCERIANLRCLHDFIDLGALGETLLASVNKQADYLLTHLDNYRGVRGTPHLINNGRGLYLAGCWLGREGLANIGRKILLTELSRQYTPEGFLDEGSSHYQLIFTRIYLDVLAEAIRSGDAAFATELGPRVIPMLKACRFFLDPLADERWQLPLIGDVAPDSPPLLFARDTNFWHWASESLDPKFDWRAIQSSCLERAPSPTTESPALSGWSGYTGAGHFRWSGPILNLWWHARPSGSLRRHAHNDWGSFQLHAFGEPIFIDPGRYSYSDAALLTFDGRKTLNQNTVAIDGFEQTPILKRSFFESGYLSQDGIDLRFSADAQGARLDMTIKGYVRLSPGAVHQRSFLIGENVLTIADRIESSVSRKTVTAFHLHPKIACARRSDKSFLLTTPKGRRISLIAGHSGVIQVKQGGDTALPGGYCYPMYGQREQTTSLFVLQNGPRILAQYEIKVEG